MTYSGCADATPAMLGVKLIKLFFTYDVCVFFLMKLSFIGP